MSKAEQMRGIKTGNGVQHLLDESHKILGNPLSLFDADYKMIAYTDVPVDDYYWNEQKLTGTHSIESQIFFMNECFTDEVANAEKLATMKSDKLKYDKILGHVFNGNGIKVANVLMLADKGTLGPDEIAAFGILTDLITNEIRDDAFYIAYGEAYQNAWIKKLIDYSIEEKRLYSPHVQILYNGFKANLFLAVLDIRHSETWRNEHEGLVGFLRRERKDFKYAIYNDYVVMIMSTIHKTFGIKRELNDLADYLKQQNIFVGISSCFDNIYALRKYYAEAVQAMNNKKASSNRHIFVYGKQD